MKNSIILFVAAVGLTAGVLADDLVFPVAETLDLGGETRSAAKVSLPNASDNAETVVLKNGSVIDTTAIELGRKRELVLENMTLTATGATLNPAWNSLLTIGAGAILNITSGGNMQVMNMQDDVRMVIDGGTYNLTSDYSIGVWQTTKSSWTIRNGGVFNLLGPKNAFYLYNTTGSKILIDGGTFLGRVAGASNGAAAVHYCLSTEGVLAVTNGSFRANSLNVTQTSCRNRFTFHDSIVDLTAPDGAVTAGLVYADNNSDNSLVVSGTSRFSAWKVDLGGERNSLDFGGASAEIQSRIYYNGNDHVVTLSGGAVTSGVDFAATTSGGSLDLKAGEWYVDGGSCYPKMLGANNVIRISDGATFVQGGAFAQSWPNDGTPGVPYQGCPGCAFEFRGIQPNLVIRSCRTTPRTGDLGIPWGAGFVLGDLTGAPLNNPVRLRFILPAEPYAQAPLRNELSLLDASYHRPISLGGNAVIEIDASAYVPGAHKARYPLVYDVCGFQLGDDATRFFLDVEGLNRTNAANLPEGATLEYVAAEKTLYLVMPKESRGLMLIFR